MIFWIIAVLILFGFYPNRETILETVVQIKAPKPFIYSQLLEIDNVQEWVSPVLESKYVEKKSGVGAIRECKLEDGSIVQEEVVGVRNNTQIDMEMISHNLPVSYFKWSILLSAESTEFTTVMQKTCYKVKYGIYGMLLNQFMVKSSLKKTFEGAYGGLKTFIEKKQD